VKRAYATLNLGFYLFLQILRRILFLKRRGLKEFLESYQPDRILPFLPAERNFDFSNCISCGLCDSVTPGNPSSWPFLSRSIPDFTLALTPNFFDSQPLGGDYEGICPKGVPLKEILLFLKNKSEEIHAPARH
jgi:hypothetical protein